MRISDWSSDVCSSDLGRVYPGSEHGGLPAPQREERQGDDGQADQGNEESRAPRRSEERREGKSVSVRVDLGGRRIIKKKRTHAEQRYRSSRNTHHLLSQINVTR